MRSRRATISVIIPVLHEADNINSVLDNVRSVKGGKDVEIIVVEGARERDTLKVLKRPCKKMVSPPGRGIQQNGGAKVSRGDILVFLHADTRLPDDALTLIRETLEDEKIQAGAFTMRFDEVPFHMRMMYPLHDLRGRITRVPLGDQVYFINRDVFDQMGGFREISILEDMDLMLRMRRSGMKIRILKEKVITSGRRYMERGPFRNLANNIFLITCFRIGLDMERLKGHYPK